MPTYDYECLECKENFEVFQKMNDAQVDKCPKCKGGVKRLIGAGLGLIFKGSGFYQTDYKKTSAVADNKTDKPKGCSSCDNNACPQSGNSE